MKYKLRHLNLGLTVGNIELFHYLYHPMLIGGSDGKESACNTGDLGSIIGSGRSLEKWIVIHTSILAWRIPWRENPGRLQSTGSQRVGHEWAHKCSHTRHSKIWHRTWSSIPFEADASSLSWLNITSLWVIKADGVSSLSGWSNEPKQVHKLL